MPSQPYSVEAGAPKCPPTENGEIQGPRAVTQEKAAQEKAAQEKAAQEKATGIAMAVARKVAVAVNVPMVVMVATAELMEVVKPVVRMPYQPVQHTAPMRQ